ncbi:mannose-6-phosphate isomerase [Enemella evansiae]|uniref:class I mannose-6-phosphate isomerase n=1 Tax=Enemella evansiae TaxID=2016499 RepID=UPI000B97C343|nr:class I mannose-6-phosphate isomerase [Enemella evansiae]OYO20056.1 mannose-6-phosphate isomerase [Enemella evansiae]
MQINAPGNYDRAPIVQVPLDTLTEQQRATSQGAEVYPAIWQYAHEAAGDRSALVVVDSYPGVDNAAIIDGLKQANPTARVIDVEERAALGEAELTALIAQNLTDDRVFGIMSHHQLRDFYRSSELSSLAADVRDAEQDIALVGWGATLAEVHADALVLADLPRWEIQQRYRAGASNWRTHNPDEDILRKYKRGFFVEWRVADNHKRPLIERIDFLLDTTHEPKLISGAAVRAGLATAARQPFRLVPFFDPGPWGGVWMEETVGLEHIEGKKYAWCFDCVPEENSLLLEVSGTVVEIPSMDLVLTHPRELLGPLTFARFGAEFPIRFDFLDTVEGGNLSLQVHPLTDYIQRTFGMHYTQDESYYLLDADADAKVYLGLKEGVEPEAMLAALARAQEGEELFDAEAYVNVFPAAKHDHFLIPAGTVHASGSGSMVLEISATPYIFTFKLWDWGRLGLDGKPRPIHLEHGSKNIQFDRDTAWTTANLVDQVQPVDKGEGWREERTGLHELEFIETRRHWFTGPVEHDTAGTVNVLNLVEGDVVRVESPTRAFEPYEVHYAETFVVPAAVGAYRIVPAGDSAEYGTLKAYVRGTQVD